MSVAVKLERVGAIAPPHEVGSLVKADSRILALDGLRGIASVMVLVYHFGPHIVREANSQFMFLHSLPPLWFSGVDLFFVLSGFLISGILLDARESPAYFKTFYARRLFRIFPLYYLVLLSYALATVIWRVNTGERLFENPLPLWTYTFYLQNFAMAATNSFGAIWMAGSWSLAVEEQFYLTLPAVIRRVADRGLFWFATGCLGVPVILRALVQKFKFAPGMANDVLLPMRADSLAVGVIVLLVLRHRQPWLTAHRRWVVRSTIAFFLMWTVYPYIPNPEAIRLGFINSNINALAFGGLLLSLLISPMSFPARLFSTRLMRSVGNMAYSTYLLHPILLCVVFRVLRSKDPDLMGLSDLVPLAVAGVITLGLSWLSWSQFESRLLKIGHRFHY